MTKASKTRLEIVLVLAALVSWSSGAAYQAFQFLQGNSSTYESASAEPATRYSGSFWPH